VGIYAHVYRKANPRMPTPNILLLMADQQRYDSLGCYGVDFAHTPNLDRLAQQGALFDNCYVNNPICTPCGLAC
jgi:arylsulfatase A-like enzyme